MRDPRVAKVAEVLVDYSTEVKEDEVVEIYAFEGEARFQRIRDGLPIGSDHQRLILPTLFGEAEERRLLLGEPFSKLLVEGR